MSFGKIRKGAMHKDLGKSPNAPITQSDIAREEKINPKRANFAKMAKRGWKPLSRENGGEIPPHEPGGFRNAAMKGRCNGGMV